MKRVARSVCGEEIASPNIVLSDHDIGELINGHDRVGQIQFTRPSVLEQTGHKKAQFTVNDSVVELNILSSGRSMPEEAEVYKHLSFSHSGISHRPEKTKSSVPDRYHNVRVKKQAGTVCQDRGTRRIQTVRKGYQYRKFAQMELKFHRIRLRLMHLVR